MEIKEITIEKFEKEFYDKYIDLFPEDEQRDWKNIRKTYEDGIEKFFEIVCENKKIGFFMLERINDSYPYYLDYFAIFKEFQDKGYGTEAVKKLEDEVIKDSGVCGEIESIEYADNEKDKEIRLKRKECWESLGFKGFDSRYSLWNVIYTPYAYYRNNTPSKEEMDKILFDYYTMNTSKELIEKNGYKLK